MTTIENSTNTSKAGNKINDTYNHLRIFGLQIPHQILNNTSFLFMFLAFSHIICSVIFAFFQEKVILVEGFEYPKFMTIVQTFTYCLMAYLELLMMGNSANDANGNFSILKPRAPIFNYVLLSCLTFSGMYFTNWSLLYLSYPTRIIFKGSKPIPTMLLEYLYVGKRFAVFEIFSVLMLTLGIVLFCSGEARDSPEFNVYGVLLIGIGVLADSLTSNFEKKNIFNFGASHAEAMFYASMFGFILCLATEVLTDLSYFVNAIYFMSNNPNCLWLLILSSIGGYMSVVFVLLLIKVFSTTYAECVKGARKVCSIAASYLMLSSGKVFGAYHAVGILCFVGSIVFTIYNKSKSKGNGKKKTPPLQSTAR